MEPEPIKNLDLKSSKSLKQSKNTLKTNKNTSKDLLMLLDEADKITLDDLEFDFILKEQTKILCDINDILNKENNIKTKSNKICNIEHLKTDTKFKEMLTNYNKKSNNKSKESGKSKSKESGKSKSKESGKSKNKQIKLTKKKCKRKTSTKHSLINIHKLKIKNKNIYKYNNRRQFDVDVTITKPNIFIKDLPTIKKMQVIDK